MMDKTVQSQFSSIKLDQLVYVELEARNGGMMLSVSEEGFTFRAVTSVRPSGRIPFSFVINGTEKLEGYGEIKWTKDDGKVAGLQFTDVSTEFLNALRKWLAQLSAPTVPASAEIRTDNAFDLDHNLRMKSPKTSTADPIVEPPSRPEFGMNFGQSLGGAAPQNEFAQASASAREPSASVLPRSTHILTEWEYPDGLPAEPRRGNGVVIAAVVACFLLLAILLYSFRETIGRSLISLGQTLSAPSSAPSETSQAQAPDTPKPAEEVQQPVPANPGKEDNPAANGGGKSSQSQASTNGGDKSESVRPQTDRETVPPPTKVETQFRDERPAPSAEESPARNTRSQDPAEEVRALWSAVGQGNTAAEVTLAKLYLIGGGVAKNCDQARVLLRAAAKKGNTEAISKLSQITRQGCP
jgi:hypothetical protein